MKRKKHSLVLEEDSNKTKVAFSTSSHHNSALQKHKATLSIHPSIISQRLLEISLQPPNVMAPIHIHLSDPALFFSSHHPVMEKEHRFCSSKIFFYICGFFFLFFFLLNRIHQTRYKDSTVDPKHMLTQLQFMLAALIHLFFHSALYHLTEAH